MSNNSPLKPIASLNVFALLLSLGMSAISIAEDTTSLIWPPELPNVVDGKATVETPQLLAIPSEVAATRSDEGVAPFEVAKTAPIVDVFFHRELGTNPTARRLWSSWGDICLASDGSVYVGIGDHHHDKDGDGRCFLYRWSPTSKSLEQIVDMNQVVTPRPGQPAWTKVHAKIDEGKDGKIYFCCTLNAGNRAGDPNYKWTKQLPGAQLYQYDPKTGKTSVFADLPAKRCTATSLLDVERNIWWCNLEAGEGDALYGLDLSTKEVVYQSKDGAVAFNRNFALGNDGSIFFNGDDAEVLRLNPKRKIRSTSVVLVESKGMRASSRQSTSGDIFGATHKTNQLFRYRPSANSGGKDQQLEMLGPTWGTGQYTTVLALSPDEKYLYYLPGAHGKATRFGTPLIQYNIQKKTQKVLAFLASALEQEIGYVPGGTYGVKISDEGDALYVNFNGHAADQFRPSHMKPIGFGLCSFMVIHIPKSER